MKTISVIQYGLGPIGAACAKLVCERPGMKLVGAIDVSPEKAGRDIGDAIGLGRTLGMAVGSSLHDVLTDSSATVVLHSTVSSLVAALPQFEECLEAGLNVVSTCEELAYPAAQYPKIADRLQFLAEHRGVTILGTGINPGYAMDALALFLSGICQRVDKVSIRRVVDASERRLPLQRKIGAGLTAEEFDGLVRSGKVRHVGLLESVALLAAGLEWTLDRMDETIEPVISAREIRSEHIVVSPGRVAGVHQISRGFVGNREVITLDLLMALRAENAGDYILIQGPQELSVAVKGIHGDFATASVVVNSVPRVVGAAAGLLTMKDLASPSSRGTL